MLRALAIALALVSCSCALPTDPTVESAIAEASIERRLHPVTPGIPETIELTWVRHAKQQCWIEATYEGVVAYSISGLHRAVSTTNSIRAESPCGWYPTLPMNGDKVKLEFYNGETRTVAIVNVPPCSGG